MRVDHRARAGCALGPQGAQERPCVSLRRSSVQHECAPIADYRAHRGSIRRTRRHPIDVFGDLRECAHRSAFEEVPRTVTFGDARAIISSRSTPQAWLGSSAMSVVERAVAVWERRFRAPISFLPEWSPDSPDQCVYASNEPGVWQLYAW